MAVRTTIAWRSRAIVCPGADDFGRNRDCDLVGGDGAKIEPHGCLEPGQPFGCNAVLRGVCLMRPPSCGCRQSDVFGFNRECREQRSLVAAALR
jgi:hypothetical protein